MNASAPLDRIPLFVRAGSILPLANVSQDAIGTEADLELRVYPVLINHLIFMKMKETDTDMRKEILRRPQSNGMKDAEL